jgi:hypothetical protein
LSSKQFLSFWASQGFTAVSELEVLAELLDLPSELLKTLGSPDSADVELSSHAANRNTDNTTAREILRLHFVPLRITLVFFIRPSKKHTEKVLLI